QNLRIELSPAETSSLEVTSSPRTCPPTTPCPGAATTAEQEAGSHSSSPRGQSVPDNKKGENDRSTGAASSISPRAIAHDKAGRVL
ncbi:hypothetical protein A2U01_0086331, partial [Trifolium medium]|nr:hypothetical protein [Trifolium medium]